MHSLQQVPTRFIPFKPIKPMVLTKFAGDRNPEQDFYEISIATEPPEPIHTNLVRRNIGASGRPSTNSPRLASRQEPSAKRNILKIFLILFGLLTVGKIGQYAYQTSRPTPSFPPLDGMSPEYIDSLLPHVSEEGRPDIIQSLIQKGADVNRMGKTGMTPLMHAAAYGTPENVQILIQNGADIHKTDNYNEKSSLMYAIESGSIKKVHILIRNGADVNKADCSGLTPLMVASSYHYPEIVRTLLRKGLDANQVDHTGRTALIHTIMRHSKRHIGQDITIIRELVWKGKADINRPDAIGQTPVFYAAQRGMHDILRELIRQKADVNKADQNGVTPLMAAVRDGQANTAKALIVEGGADIYRIDKDGKTARDYASNETIRKILDLPHPKD